MSRAVSQLLLVLLVGFVALGCGGSQRLDYEHDLAKVGSVVDRSLAKLPKDDSETIGPEQVTSLAEDLREAADQLHDLDPPGDAVRPQRRLEHGLRGIAAAFDDLARRLTTADTDAQKAELFVQFATDEKIDSAFNDVIAAQDAYAQAGYRVFGTNAPAKPATATGSSH